MYYIYSIKTGDSIKGRKRHGFGEERERNNGILAAFLDNLEKNYPKGNFLKIYYDSSLPNLLITDTKLSNLKIIIFSHQKYAVPYGEHVRLIEELNAKDFLMMRGKFKIHLKTLYTNANKNYYLENTRGCYGFGPNYKKIFKDYRYWKMIAGIVAKYF